MLLRNRKVYNDMVLVVNINFDEAHKRWIENKKYIGMGEYIYK